jgi:hypothetical protein
MAPDPRIIALKQRVLNISILTPIRVLQIHPEK